MKIKDFIKKKQNLITLIATSYTKSKTFDGNDTIITLHLKVPLDTIIGSVPHDNIETRERNCVTKVNNPTEVKLIASEFGESHIKRSKRQIRLSVRGVLDVSKPKFNRLTGEKIQESQVWLRKTKFVDIPKMMYKG